MKLSDLCGEKRLSGVDMTTAEIGTQLDPCEAVRFCLDGVNYLAICDPDDGYRSFLAELQISGVPCVNRFPEQRVAVLHDEDLHDDVIKMVNPTTGGIILRIGTEDYMDYYPICVMEYHPENMDINL